VRFQILGASPFVIHFAGNLKYACGAGDANKKFGLSLELKNALVGRQIWLAASTHVEEEEGYPHCLFFFP
jgi:3-deoxy-D-manno-octulosonic-acid transferase